MDISFAPGAIDLFLFARLIFTCFTGMLDSLFQSRNFGPHGIKLRLHAIEAIQRIGLMRADFFNLGLNGTLRAETRDDEAANNLRDVVRGFVALAKLQAGSRPEFQAVVQSLELGGSDKTVTLSFSVSGEVFDAIGAAARPPQR